jgi:ATP/maltotriose-dependent transcriptional regulator MalT/DNA-binding SARP family transcriptional activator
MGSVVRREALFARLDGAPGRTLVWISGPPGAGKTTLAASYIAARGYQRLWYQIDADDSDAATFFHYLRHAARKLDGARARELPAFTAQHQSDVASFARKFFRQLFSRLKAPIALVLDNLHAIAAESPLYAALEAGFTQVPKTCCVIVTSRSEPPAALARQRAAGEMCCVTGEHLRVTPDELAAIANLRGQSLSPEAVQKLHERTQGWAAGLVLMLEHAKISGRIADLPGDATPQVVFDYLAGEIFDRFEPQVQAFLLRVACLPRMTAEVAAALSGEAKAGRMLLNLALNDYFVREALSDEGRIYELHPLLREFLRGRAAHALPEAVSPGWLQRAAGLLRASGHPEDAVALLAECRAWQEVGSIALAEAPAMLAQGRNETLGSWLDLLPPQLLESDPALLGVYATCRAHASPRAARRLFERAFEGFRTAGDTAGMLQSCCGVVNALIFEFDDLTPLDRWTGALAGLLGERAAGSPEEVEPAAAATLIRALLLRDAGSAELGQWLDRVGRWSDPDTADDALEAQAELALARGMGALLRGDFAASYATIEALQSRTSELPPGPGLALRIAAALHHLLTGAYAEAQRVARDGLAVAGSEGIHAYDEWLRVIAAAALLGAGDRDGARSELQGLESAGARLRRGDRGFIHYLRGWLAALEGDVAGAHREARAALAVAVETGLPWLECLVRTASAQVLAGDGDHRGADAQLRGAAALADRLASPLLRFGVRLATAEAANEANDRRTALGCLKAAFELGREYGFQHALGWRPRAIADLCALALREGIEADFAGGLVRARRLVPRAAPLRVRAWPWAFRIGTLGGFELARAGAPVEFSGKGPGRPGELLKVLVALGGQNVRADQLADALWPHVDADFAHKSFTATLHRLRRVLEEEDALVLRDGRLSLNPALFWVDIWALEQVFAELDGALRGPIPKAMAPAAGELAEEALALYRGPFLPDESEQPSYIACREQLRARLLRCLARLARGWEEAGKPDAAADCYLRCIEADELCEPLYRHLMLCYQRHGDQGEALATYERLRTILWARGKAMPSPETQAVHASLRSSPAVPAAPQ